MQPNVHHRHLVIGLSLSTTLPDKRLQVSSIISARVYNNNGFMCRSAHVVFYPGCCASADSSSRVMEGNSSTTTTLTVEVVGKVGSCDRGRSRPTFAFAPHYTVLHSSRECQVARRHALAARQRFEHM